MPACDERKVELVALPYRITPEGDAALMVRFGTEVDDALVGLSQAAARRLEGGAVEGVTDVVPGYCTVMVCYDPLLVTYTELCAQVGLRLHGLDAAGAPAAQGRLLEVPVCYEGDLAPDLADVAAHAGLDPDEVVRRHAAGTYLVCLLGFLPGFAYLSGLDPSIACPRLETPRTLVPAGAVGIAGTQTGMYPLASPGGWRLIGRTPARLYDPALADPVPYRPGDRLRFRSVSRAEFDELAARAAEGAQLVVDRGAPRTRRRATTTREEA